MINLEGKTALITGASRGIGRTIAEKLHLAGAKVILIARNEERLKELSEKLENSEYYPLDITDRKQVLETLKEVQKDNHIDILVNNAGITRDNILLAMKENEIDDVIDTNLKSVFFITKQVLRKMLKKRYGRIINITSVIGLMGNAGQSNYAASKAGIIGFTKSLAKEIGSRNITVNAIAPGFIETDMTGELSEDVKKEMIKSIPLGRTGTPEDIANAVLFLASDLAGYITGTVLNVSGGMYI